MVHWYSEGSKHKLSGDSWVCFLDCSILCFYLSGEAPPIHCYHGDSPSWVSCLQGGEQAFSVLNPVNVECINMQIHIVGSQDGHKRMCTSIHSIQYTNLMCESSPLLYIGKKS